jgi:hypothetical protein
VTWAGSAAAAASRRLLPRRGTSSSVGTGTGPNAALDAVTAAARSSKYGAAIVSPVMVRPASSARMRSSSDGPLPTRPRRPPGGSMACAHGCVAPSNAAWISSAIASCSGTRSVTARRYSRKAGERRGAVAIAVASQPDLAVLAPAAEAEVAAADQQRAALASGQQDGLRVKRGAEGASAPRRRGSGRRGRRAAGRRGRSSRRPGARRRRSSATGDRSAGAPVAGGGGRTGSRGCR